MNYCPAWIYDTIIAQTAYDFLANDAPLVLSANKFVNALAKKYEPLASDEVSACSEEMIRFLSEVEADEESANLLLGFCFFRVRYQAQNVKRKMNPMFGSVDVGDKSRKYSGDDALKRFKAYVFAWRSKTAILSDPGWKLSNETILEELSKAAAQKISVFDSL